MFSVEKAKITTEVNRTAFTEIIGHYLSRLSLLYLLDEDGKNIYPIQQYYRILERYGEITLGSIYGRNIVYRASGSICDGYEAVINNIFLDESLKFDSAAYIGANFNLCYAGIARFDFDAKRFNGLLSSDGLCAGMIFDPIPIDTNVSCKFFSSNDTVFGSLISQDSYLLFTKLEDIESGQYKYIVMTRPLNKLTRDSIPTAPIFIIDNTIKSYLNVDAYPLDTISSNLNDGVHDPSRIYVDNFVFRNRWRSNDIYIISGTTANNPIAIDGDLYYPLGFGLFLKVK
jgi:hypothetical protein